jgi:hypothetical protein
MSEGTYTVGFMNQAQVALYEAEIKGQISDGNWENSNPHNHWEIPCKAKAFVATCPEELGTNWIPVRYYDFANAELLEVVANRMIGYVKFYTLYPEIDSDFVNHHSLEYMCSPRSLTTVIDRAERDSYYNDKLTLFKTLFGVSTVVGLMTIAEQVADVPYTMIDLKRDLGQMKKIFHCRQKNSTNYLPISNNDAQAAIDLFARYQVNNVQSVRSGGRAKRPYLELASNLLNEGVYDKAEIAHLISVSYPEVKKSSLDTFFTDLKNAKYSAFKPRVVVTDINGKLKFRA